MASPNPKLDELIAVLAKLRAPGGCAWDADQTHESLVRYLIEETHELVDAIETGTRDDLIEELGDVLYQVIFHSDIAAHTPEENFTLEDVAAHMTAKMIARHPHVFGDAEAKAALGIETADDVTAVWDDLKATEKPHRTSVLDGIPQGMPALALADKLVGRAEKVGVAIPDAAVSSAAPRATPTAVTETELGAQLLAIVASARAAGLDPERALRSTLRGLQSDIRETEKQSQRRQAFPLWKTSEPTSTVEGMKKTSFDKLLTEQIGHEFAASQQYVAIAVWYDNHDLPQLARHFYSQSIEERNHAMMLVQYRLDRDLGVTIPGVPDVINEFKDERAPVSLALAQEKQVTEQIEALFAVARAEGDALGEQFMLWFLKEQVEEVASMSTLLTIMTRAENLFDVENYLSRESVGEAADASAPAAAGGAL